jgi:hypothetical protein
VPRIPDKPSNTSGHIQEPGGQGGIRTHDTLAGMPHFECGAFNHSTTCPAAEILERPRIGKANPRKTPASSHLGAAGRNDAIPVRLRFHTHCRISESVADRATTLRPQSFGLRQPFYRQPLTRGHGIRPRHLRPCGDGRQSLVMGQRVRMRLLRLAMEGRLAPVPVETPPPVPVSRYWLCFAHT